jgi:hypothetical protein
VIVIERVRRWYGKDIDFSRTRYSSRAKGEAGAAGKLGREGGNVQQQDEKMLAEVKFPAGTYRTRA